MSVLDDIRDGKGLKPITFNCFTCQNENCIISRNRILTYQCPDYKAKRRVMKVSDDFATYRPTSTDPKPLDAPHGTIIQEDDTKDYYCFDANKKMWTKIAE